MPSLLAVSRCQTPVTELTLLCERVRTTLQMHGGAGLGPVSDTGYKTATARPSRSRRQLHRALRRVQHRRLDVDRCEAGIREHAASLLRVRAVEAHDDRHLQ